MRVVVFALCGFVGGLAGAFLVQFLTEERAPRTARDGRPVVSDAPSRQEFDDLSQRIRRLEQGRGAPLAPGASDAPDAPAATPGEAGDAPEAGGGPTAKKTPNEVVQALVGKPFGFYDSNRLVGWLSRNKDRIADVIKGIEKEIEKNPNDPNLHVALAAAWTAELINQPPGPQQGLMWGKVGASYDAALTLEPNHWQARFGKAFGTSMAPEFLGMRPEAIRQFEELKEIQGRRAPEPQHAQVYFRLGTLYKDAGNAEKARSLWAEGLKLFPDNQELKDTLEASTKK
jgi:tetratricopeptide (TPR) repeat protein